MESLFNTAKSTAERVSQEYSQTENTKEQQWERKKKLSYDQIFNDIVKDSESKITTYAEAGYFRVSLFSYTRNDNLKYNGIFASDLLRKGDVMERLREHFKPFRVYLNRYNSNGNFRDVVSVVWYDQKEKPPMDDEEQNNEEQS